MSNGRGLVRFKRVSILLSALVVSYMGLGIARVARTPVLGVMFCPGYEICRLFPGSPAEKAGLRLGDKIRSIDGARIDEVGPLGKGPALPGQLHSYGIARGGERIEIEVRLEPPSLRSIYLRLAPSLVGLVFILTGLYVSLRRPDRVSRVLLYLSLCVGWILSYPPWMEGARARFLLGAFEIVASFGLVGSLCQLSWLFPRPKRFLVDHPRLTRIVFALAGLAATALIAAIGCRLLLHLSIPHRLHVALEHLAAFVILGAFLVAAASFLHSYVTTPPGTIKNHLHLVMAALVLGLAPVLSYVIWFAVNPRRELPLEGQVVLLCVLIPLSLGYAVVHLPAENDPAPARPRTPRDAT